VSKDIKVVLLILAILAITVVIVIEIIYVPAIQTPPSSSSPPTSSESTHSEPQKQWIKIRTFAGVGDKTTALFNISSNKWRINWAVETKRPDLGVFVLYVYPEGETRSYMFIEQIMHDCDGDYNDTTYVYEGNGSFYIRIECSNLKGWTLEVESWQ